jgi:hypothetical protein
MAIGTATALGIGGAVLGGILNTRNKNKQAQRQEQYGQQQAAMMQGMMQRAPTGSEMWGQQMLGQMGARPLQFDATSFNQYGFNTGQDAIMQALRTDPTAKSNQALEGIIAGGGNPFDTSALFSALGVMDQRATDTAVAQTRAGASGLGQRFGSYMARQEGDMRLRANEAAAARNAQIQMQSYGDAQQRLLASIGALSGNEQFAAQQQLAGAGQLQQGALNASNIGLQAAGMNQQAQLQGQAQQADLLRSLLGAEQTRQGQNIQLAGLAAGLGAPQGRESYGSILSGAGSLLTMPGVLRSNPYVTAY